MTTKGLTWIAFALITTLYVAGLTLVVASGEQLGLNELVLLVFYTFAVVGVLIALRRPENRIAWICLGVGFIWGLEALLVGAVVYGLATSASAAWIGVVAAIGVPLWIPGIFGTLIFVFLLFPNGRVPSPRWRWLPWVAGLGVLWWYVFTVLSEPETYGYGRPRVENPLAILRPLVEEDNLLTVVWEIGYTSAIFLTLIASVVALVMRYRRSTGLERQQLKWLATAGATVAVLFMVTALFLADWLGDDVGLLGGSLLILIPVSIGIAVLKHRLYDIDRLVSRTVAYGLVVGVLAGVFALIAIGLPRLFGVPEENPVLVAAATLAAAALFNPLRRRVQAMVDRRFNRARFDAQQEVERFAERLRDELEMEDLTDEVLRVVDKTMQPDAAAIWVREES